MIISLYKDVRILMSTNKKLFRSVRFH